MMQCFGGGLFRCRHTPQCACPA